MSRYTEAPQEVVDLMNRVIEEHFSELVNCYIKILLDNKKRKSKGQYSVASIKKTNEKEKYLSADDFYPQGYDFLMIIDENIFHNISEDDKLKIIFHNLSHILYDPEAKDPYKIQDHDFVGFKKETETFPDIFDTWDRLQEIADSVYDG